MLPNIPRPKSRDAIYPGDVENIHQEVQVGMLRDVPQHTLRRKDVFVINMFVHDVPRMYIFLFTSAHMAIIHGSYAISGHPILASSEKKPYNLVRTTNILRKGTFPW